MLIALFVHKSVISHSLYCNIFRLLDCRETVISNKWHHSIMELCCFINNNGVWKAKLPFDRQWFVNKSHSVWSKSLSEWPKQPRPGLQLLWLVILYIFKFYNNTFVSSLLIDVIIMKTFMKIRRLSLLKQSFDSDQCQSSAL